ncbi:hypothetical protein E2C01_061507 [Portunus trituberculatus]|uniref:Uncharacterized protein n=1 Tax=Portunus trituberculatus TaxID=210409 RepID=A0A5B7HB54_PORTR|nr:hypothetical protein [Portunus trituberculatus]
MKTGTSPGTKLSSPGGGAEVAVADVTPDHPLDGRERGRKRGRVHRCGPTCVFHSAPSRPCASDPLSNPSIIGSVASHIFLAIC